MPVTYTIPGRRDDAYDYEHTWTVTKVGGYVGPCATCEKDIINVTAIQHTRHKGLEYDRSFDWIELHADGSPPHDGKTSGVAKPQCPHCKVYGTLTIKQQAYGDSTDCSACGYHHWYDIGD